MTIIDTTLYCDGELRLAHHGAGKGGTVLMHVPSGAQVNIHPDRAPHIDHQLSEMERLGWRSGPVFDMVGFNERDYRLVLSLKE